MNDDVENQIGVNPMDQPIEEQIDTAKIEVPRKSSFKWLLAIAFIFLLGLGVFWYIKPLPNQSFFPVQSLGDASLVTFKNFDFQEPIRQSWKEHAFKHHTAYKVENENLHASSMGTSSMLYQEVKIPVSERPILVWDWKAVQFPGNKQGKGLADKSDNDFAGRVYAIFKSQTPIADVIQYVWDDHFSEGKASDSPFLKNVRILVVQSGKSDEWVSEKRDLLEDYRKLFGRNPRWPLSAIGVMSDSDNTKTQSEIYYRNLSLKKPQAS